MGFELSHPRIVSGELDYYNSTLTLVSYGSGECNVFIYMARNPSIYDVFKVKVSTVVMPASPVNLHVGGEISFKIMENERP